MSIKETQVETLEERQKRLDECASLIKEHRGKIISTHLAKEIAKLSKTGYSIYEQRIDNNRSLVIMERGTIGFMSGKKELFLVEGDLGNQPIMKDNWQ